MTLQVHVLTDLLLNISYLKLGKDIEIPLLKNSPEAFNLHYNCESLFVLCYCK